MKSLYVIDADVIESFSSTRIVGFRAESTHVVSIRWQCLDKRSIVEVAVVSQRKYDTVMITGMVDNCLIRQRANQPASFNIETACILFPWFADDYFIIERQRKLGDIP